MNSGKPVCHHCKNNFLHLFGRKQSVKNDADPPTLPSISRSHPEGISDGHKFETVNKAETKNLFNLNSPLNSELYCNGMSCIDLDHVAKQLCMIDAELMGNISWSELRNMGWIKTKTKSTESPNVLAMIRQSNMVGNRVICEILSREKLSFRVKTVIAFIKLAYKLWDMGNCNSSRIVVAALQDQSVYRLKLTWDGVSSKYTKMFDCLSRFFNPCTNPSSCRRYLDHRLGKGLPFIPFLGTFLTRVVYVISAKELAFDSPVQGGVNSVMKVKDNDYIQRAPHTLRKVPTSRAKSTESERETCPVAVRRNSEQQVKQSKTNSSAKSSDIERTSLGEDQMRGTADNNPLRSLKSMDDTIFVSVSSENDVSGPESQPHKVDPGYSRTSKHSDETGPIASEFEDDQESREEIVKDVQALSPKHQHKHFFKKHFCETQKCKVGPKRQMTPDDSGAQHRNHSNTMLEVPKFISRRSRSDAATKDSSRHARLVGVIQKDFIFKSAFHHFKFQQQGNGGAGDFFRINSLSKNETNRQSRGDRSSTASPVFLFDDSDLDISECVRDVSSVAANALRELKEEFKSYKIACKRYQYSECRLFRDFITATKLLDDKKLYELSLSRESGHP